METKCLQLLSKRTRFLWYRVGPFDTKRQDAVIYKRYGCVTFSAATQCELQSWSLHYLLWPITP